jgi:hypothetical protein
MFGSVRKYSWGMSMNHVAQIDLFLTVFRASHLPQKNLNFPTAFSSIIGEIQFQIHSKLTGQSSHTNYKINIST